MELVVNDEDYVVIKKDEYKEFMQHVVCYFTEFHEHGYYEADDLEFLGMFMQIACETENARFFNLYWKMKHARVEFEECKLLYNHDYKGLYAELEKYAKSNHHRLKYYTDEVGIDLEDFKKLVEDLERTHK